MKKILVSLMLFVLVVFLTFSLSACKDGEDTQNVNENEQNANEAKKECTSHQWIYIGGREPDCRGEGYENYRCEICSEKKTILIDEKGPCPYESEWIVAGGGTICGLQLTCKNHASHNKTLVAEKQVTVLSTPTCKEKGKTRTLWVANHDGITYKKEILTEQDIVRCKYEYKYSLAGDYCYEGILGECVCVWCGSSKKQLTTYDHSYSNGSSELIDLKNSTCGITVYQYRCLCGEKSSISYKTGSCELAEIEDLRQTTVENGVVSLFTTSVCTVCGVKIEKWQTYLEKYETPQNFINFEIKITDKDGILIYSGRSYNHNNTGHELEVAESVSLGDCKAGTLLTYACTSCNYTEKVRDNTVVHKRETTTIDLKDYCGCDEIITIKGKCPCGEYTQENISSFHKGHEYEEIDPSDVLPDGFVPEGNDIKARKYSCGLIYFNNYCLKEEYDHYLYKIIVIKYGDEAIYDNAPKDFENPDSIIDKEFGRPITDEEKRVMINYFKNMLENEELDEKTRLKYQAYIDQLEAELGS